LRICSARDFKRIAGGRECRGQGVCYVAVLLGCEVNWWGRPLKLPKLEITARQSLASRAHAFITFDALVSALRTRLHSLFASQSTYEARIICHRCADGALPRFETCTPLSLERRLQHMQCNHDTWVYAAVALALCNLLRIYCHQGSYIFPSSFSS
jgi:hypothetical protein